MTMFIVRAWRFKGFFWPFFGHNFFHINIRKKITYTLWIKFLSSFNPCNKKMCKSSHFWEIRTVWAWRWLPPLKFYPKFDHPFFRSSPLDIPDVLVYFEKYSWEQSHQRAKLSDLSKKSPPKKTAPPCCLGVTFGRDEKWSSKFVSQQNTFLNNIF